MIRRTVFAIDADSQRFALGGVLFEMNGNEVFAVGADGRRLARQVGTGLSIGGHATTANQTIVPGRSLALVAKAISDLDDDAKVNVAARSKDIVIDTGRGSVTCRLVEGKYPNWKQVIPSDRKKAASAWVGGGSQHSPRGSRDRCPHDGEFSGNF